MLIKLPSMTLTINPMAFGYLLVIGSFLEYFIEYNIIMYDFEIIIL